MKAILIDATNKTVTDVEIDGRQNVLQQWYKLLNVEMVEVAYYLDDTDCPDSILVDEEGLLKPLDKFFAYKGAHQPFAGNGLITGVDEDGNSVSCKLSAADVIDKIEFMNLAQVQESLRAPR